jgi:hypothetical protein
MPPLQEKVLVVELIVVPCSVPLADGNVVAVAEGSTTVSVAAASRRQIISSTEQ